MLPKKDTDAYKVACEHLSIAMKRRWADPEYKKNQIEKLAVARKKRVVHHDINIICLNCGKPLMLQYGRRHQKYCDQKCCKEYQRKDKNQLRECEFCGNTFIKNLSSKARFCSRDCANKSHIQIQMKKCENCGKGFVVTKCQNIKRFCSPKCYGESMLKKEEHFCKTCGKSFLTVPSRKEPIHCSRKCQLEETEQNKLRRVCLVCGNEFKISPKCLKERPYDFCSRECRYKSKCRNISKAWYGGVSYDDSPQYCEKFNAKFKERVRAFRGYMCFECGIPQNGTKLHVHHVHYDKKMCCNGSPRDVVPLCTSCHSKTNVNRDYWEDHFTERIYEHDPEGKCFFTKDEFSDWLSLNSGAIT